MKYKTSPSSIGAVVSVRGSVVDVRFDAHLPSIYSLLRAKEGEIATEVLAQLDAHRVRGIAMTTTEGLARGMVVEDTGGRWRHRSARKFFRACSTCSETPSTACRRRRMAHSPSRSTVLGAAFYQVRALRDGY